MACAPSSHAPLPSAPGLPGRTAWHHLLTAAAGRAAAGQIRSLEAVLQRHVEAAGARVSSLLAWIEIGRALRTRLNGEDADVVNQATEEAMAGIAERPMTGEVVSLARRVGPRRLRRPDASREAGLPVSAPA